MEHLKHLICPNDQLVRVPSCFEMQIPDAKQKTFSSGSICYTMTRMDYLIELTAQLTCWMVKELLKQKAKVHLAF